MAGWNSGRGLLGPLAPLLGAWRSSSVAALCVRTFRPVGQGWVELDARWEMEGRGEPHVDHVTDDLAEFLRTAVAAA